MADAQSLIQAAGEGDTEVVRSILSAGLDANTTNGGGETALIRAAGNGHAEIVRLLLARGADVNAKGSDGMTPLIRSAFFGHPEAAQILIARGADLSVRDRLGSTAMDWALAKGHDEVAKTLSEEWPLEQEEDDDETLIQRPPELESARPESPATLPVQHSQRIPQSVQFEETQEARRAPEVSPEQVPEDEITEPREVKVSSDKRSVSRARAVRQVAPARVPPQVTAYHPAVENNRLYIALTTLAIFVISGAVVYAITAGLQRSAVSQDQSESSIEVPPSPTLASPTPTPPSATPKLDRTASSDRPSAAPDAVDAAKAENQTMRTASVKAAAPAEKAPERSAAPTVRTTRAAEKRDPPPAKTTRKKTDGADENRRNVKTGAAAGEQQQRREAVVRRPAVRESAPPPKAPPVTTSTPASNPPPSSKKKVIQWP